MRRSAAELLHFSNIVDRLDTPQKVLEALHEAVRGTCHLAVLAAILLPIKMGDVDSLELGKTVFLHRSVPKGFWDEFLELARRHLPASRDAGLSRAWPLHNVGSDEEA